MEYKGVETHNKNKRKVRKRMDKYCIYLRKSRKDIEAEKLGEGETLAKHKNILTSLAARQGYYIEKIYSEIVSGETIKDRPEIQKMIEDCYAGKYKGILIIEISRLSRGNQGDAQIILDCLKYSNKNNGVLVITPTKIYDIAHNADDEEYLEFELFMSRREYKMINKRQQRGKLQAIVEGNYMGSYRPYGWNIKKTKVYRTLEPHPTEFEWCKKMYEWKVNEKMTPFKIAKRLTMLGVPTYYGASEWNRAAVVDILKNPVNMGKVRWNDRMQVKTMKDGEIVTSRPRSTHSEQYMLFDGKQPLMVDEETWMKANEDFKPDRTKANFKLINPLAGILVCKKCGKAMAYHSYRSKKGASPRFNHQQSINCKVKSVVVTDALNAVIHGLKLYIEDFQMKIDNLPTNNETAIEAQISALNNEAKKIERKLSKLFDSWENETITDNEFVERKTIHNERIENIKKEIAKLEISIPEKEEYEEKILLLSQALESLLDDEVDAAEKNEFLKAVVDKIEYSRENNAEFILDIFLK